MLIAYVVDNAIVRYPVSLYEDFPYTSFPYPMSDIALPEGYTQVQEVISPDHDDAFQFVTELTPVQVDGIWTQQWQLNDVISNATG